MLSQPAHRIIEVDKDYDISVDDGDYFVVSVSFTANHRSAHFTHPNIARTLEQTLGAEEGRLSLLRRSAEVRRVSSRKGVFVCRCNN